METNLKKSKQYLKSITLTDFPVRDKEIKPSIKVVSSVKKQVVAIISKDEHMIVKYQLNNEIKSAYLSEIVMNSNVINEFSSDDAFKLGYAAAHESVFQESFNRIEVL